MKSIGEGRLQYATTSADTNYYNIAKDLAAINARNEEITDREGNLYGYWCKVETTSLANDVLTLAWVPNTWKVRNAFRKFHFAREHMFREAGVTKREMGKYGRTLRPYFSIDHQTSGDRAPGCSIPVRSQQAMLQVVSGPIPSLHLFLQWKLQLRSISRHSSCRRVESHDTGF